MISPEQAAAVEFLSKRKRVLIPESEISNRVKEMAVEIKATYAPTGDKNEASQLVLLGVLKGAAPFTDQLHKELFRLGLDVPVEYLPASSYGNGTVSSGELIFTLSDKLIRHLHGKDVLITEDVIDTGLTLTQLKAKIQELAQPRSIKIAAAVDKKEQRKVPLDGDFVGFQMGKYWLEGYGMDTNELGRGNPDIVQVIPAAEYLVQLQALQQIIQSLMEDDVLPSSA